MAMLLQRPVGSSENTSCRTVASIVTAGCATISSTNCFM